MPLLSSKSKSIKAKMSDISARPFEDKAVSEFSALSLRQKAYSVSSQTLNSGIVFILISDRKHGSVRHLIIIETVMNSVCIVFRQRTTNPV